MEAQGAAGASAPPAEAAEASASSSVAAAAAVAPTEQKQQLPEPHQLHHLHHHHHQQQQPTDASSAPLQQRPRVMARDRFNHQSLGASLNSSVKQARVLMVGAGGIGCELLKNLVLAGFGEIHIVDLDTIDLSNLNRQFLFRHEHIKKSKALVAKDAAQKFNPNVQIVAHHANIKDAQFSVAWFHCFHIVYNALDNLEARRHVNRMCLAADVPLIESGTTGFNGQVQVIKKGVTACYDCTPKETPKSFPVCTIRSTPSQPIHCIVWAKSYLLNEIFATSEEGSAFDHSTDAENAQEIEELRKESRDLKQIREAVGTETFPQMLFDKVFNKDIERLRSVEDMWKSRRPPEPLVYKTVMSQAGDALAPKEQILRDDQKAWSLEESLVVFKDSLDRLSKRMLQLKQTKEPSAPEPTISFDKDDLDTLDFVASSANIRSAIFGIDRKSRFDIKQMAGNIIPAIATTNAIVAGLSVLESFKVLRGEFAQSKEVFLTPFASARLLASDRSREPNLECPVCGVFNTSIVVDPARATLNDVVEDIVKLKLGFGDKEFVVNNDIGILCDADETENLPKTLSELGIHEGSFLTIIDEDDEDTFVNVVVAIQEGITDGEEKPVKSSFVERPEIPRKPKKLAQPEANEPEHKGIKRSHPDDEGQPTPTKKAKMVDSMTSDVVIVEDAGGAIVIDDD
ncbi:thiF family protein [Hirsutella rhossiliensis]|uniref:Ubiquitin-activating enzyme E1-like n=1 Tax=Hirsutella rhossiliensis TaxID=111463 RepID=A0A9P8MX84_9HYPO|nr:thiF family domain-containing protein [Hirsutella rhossiliensis]KAH0960837.1 thiF family domain-containing protein [Hirsutella rhossiliensis]